MSAFCLMIVAVWVLGGPLAAFAAPKTAETPSEPKLTSAYPFTGQRGTTFTAIIRGTGLRGATTVFSKTAPFTTAIEGIETEPVEDVKPSAKPKAPIELVRVKIQIDAAAKAGRYPIRLITPAGISNAIPIAVIDHPVTDEPAPSHETPDTAVVISKLPAALNGRIAQRGETDYYAFHADAGETVTFEVFSGLPSTGAAGGNANGFDPSLSIYERSGSWFDPKRVNRIAFNDEPLWVLGKGTDAYLVQRFEKAGEYLVRVEAFSGQGGLDYGYHLKVATGEAPQERSSPGKNWAERKYERALSTDRLNDLAERGGKARDQAKIETYRTSVAPASSAPMFRLPGTLESAITQPGEAQRSKFHLDGPQDIAIEIETPTSAPPLFNPIVRLLNAAGEEVATNVFAGRGLCTGELNKSLQAKVIVPLRDAGDY
ncbi:MAG: DVUA0089 family protein, partial [Bryobacteraceae bacterium]